MQKMIEIQEAVNLINEFKPELRSEVIPIGQANGRILATTILAPFGMPGFDNSAMDGFAVSWDLLDKTLIPGIELEITGESQAGNPFIGEKVLGSAIRISTGAKLPDFCDTVIPIEECDETTGKIKIHSMSKRGKHVRKYGEEFEPGEPLLEVGQKLNGAQLGLLASVGIDELKVFHKPRVSILVTGNELNSPSNVEGDGAIFDSNTPMLMAAIQNAGAKLVHSIQVEDSLSETERAISNAASNSDLILSTGGVSVGIHDHIREASQNVGFKEIFWKINQKPGKPLYFATHGDVAFLGLPGNPVSAYICYHYYGHKLLQRIEGSASDEHECYGKVGEKIVNHSDRSQFYRIRLEANQSGDTIISGISKQGSHMLTSVGWADGYIILKGNQIAQPGEFIKVHTMEGD